MAEVAFGVTGLVGTIDVCIKWGRALAQACEDYQQVDVKLAEMVVRIQACWVEVLYQLEVTRNMERTMPEDHRDIQQRMFSILGTKLENATQKLSKCDRSNFVRKLQFVRLREALEQSITELEAWQKRYQPSWFFLIKHAPQTVDTMLRDVTKTAPRVTAEPALEVSRTFRRAFKEPTENSQSVFIREKELENYQKEAIPFSTVHIATRPGEPRQLIVDETATGAVTKKDARDFARRLRSSDPFTFGILSCKGVVRQSENSSMAFLSRVPGGYTSVRSLRKLLLSGQAHDSLSDRLEMAKQLVNAVYYVHLYGFVHKSIRPETILSLGKAEEESPPSMAFLVGFQVVRKADGRTYPLNDVKWETDLYRHPLRQGSNADYYVMQHDIYSLGVCLLEIGLWESFIAYGADGIARPSAILGLDEDQSQLKNPSTLKEHLCALSGSSALRSKMGTKYSEVIETCLTCLDEDNLDFGDEGEFEDEDGVAVGVRYIEKIQEIMHSISL